MVQLDKYLHDGANWQAQAVLAYLRTQYAHILSGTYDKEHKWYWGQLYVGRYENCREQGYIFIIQYKGKQRNYAVYEHRNSDRLCVVVFDRLTINTPTADMVWDAMGDNKYNVTKVFEFGQIVECGDYISDDIQEYIQKLNEESTEEKS